MAKLFYSFCYLLTATITLVSIGLNFFPVVSGESKNHGHSKLVLFRGKERFLIDGKSCTVGVAFDKGERFSCACVNGIWAFYGDPCEPPLAMVGGHNYCFQMPNVPIRQVTTIGSPMRALSDSLTIFEPNMAAVKTKIYRSVHMKVEETAHFVTTNSSWTLLDSNGQEGICLHSKEPLVDLDSGKIQPMYCTFNNVTKRLPNIGGMKKGCNGTNGSLEIVEPEECQPVFMANSEKLCSSIHVLESFDKEAEGDGNDLALFRGARENFQEWNSVTTSTTSTEPPSTTTSIYPPGYDEAPGWLQRKIRQMVEDGTYSLHNKQAGRSITGGNKLGAGEIPRKSEAEILEMMNKEWRNPMDFTLPPPINSNVIITDQLWKYTRQIIRKNLNIKTPEDTMISEKSRISKPSKLLNIARDVMKIICPLQKPEYFDMVTEVFLQMQQKIFRWKESFIKTLDFKRIEAALMVCQREAQPLVPEPMCGQSKENNGTEPEVTDPSTPPEPVVPMPEVLKSDGMEPIIESVWKIFVSAHSYCYKNFNQFYNDHHKFTTIMFPFFTNEIHKHWFRNVSNLNASEFGEEYAGIIGPVGKIMSNIDECTFAARKHSTFPFHMTRPTPLEKIILEQSDNKKDSVRRKRAVSNKINSKKRRKGAKKGAEAIIYASKASTTTPAPARDFDDGQNNAWKKERRILNGMGFCLKKYVEPKLYLDYRCAVTV